MTEWKENRALIGLNDKQEEAVLQTEGPVLILAGAGSGKTRVLVHRIAHLIEDLDAAPGNIMAITFTNKAAEEMRRRVDEMVGFGASAIWVSTFHSSCVRILRQHIEKIGYDRYFTIYDTDDQVRVIKDLMKEMDIDSKRFREKSVLGTISRAKDELITPEEYEKQAADEYETVTARVYKRYQARLLKNNALDFDDLIMKTVELFRSCPEVLSYYQERFRYIMVDEYQDTNTAQFVFTSLLAGKYRNLCVVGDDDQSIYKFRGANIMNILNFEEKFPDAHVVRLEQNYRSTQNILDCANEIISNNRKRKKKKLWTQNGAGAKVRFLTFENGFEEASSIADEIASRVEARSAEYKDFAVLYRTNAQSRLFEEKFIYANIPYRIVGGVNFYSRLEIKDLLAYLHVIDNPRDALAIRRIINVPKRGIGAASLTKIEAYAADRDIDFYDALREGMSAGVSAKTAEKMSAFVSMMDGFAEKAKVQPVAELIETILTKTGYRAELEEEHTDEADGRIENLNELISKAAVYDENEDEPSLSGFLAEVALIADIDSVEDSDNVVLLMTLHSSKGLEFPYVYIAGMEDGLFPSYLSIDSGDDAEMEEERRLAYVGITRAKKNLTLSAAMQRMLRGNIVMNPPSRFVRELPRELVDVARVSGGRPYEPFSGRNRMSSSSMALRDAMNREPKVPSYVAAARSGNPYAGQEKPYKQAPKKQFSVRGKEPLSYKEGDRVRHMRFGEGTVKEISEGGRDYEVTVQFDSVGIKKMFASFANLAKV